MLEDLKNEVQEFSESLKFMNDKDRARLQEVLNKIDIKPETLEDDMARHMELESDLAWLASKFEEMAEEAKAQAESYKSESAVSHTQVPLGGKAPAAWVVTALVEADKTYQSLEQDYRTKYRVFRFIEALQRSMIRRDTLINAWSKRDWTRT